MFYTHLFCFFPNTLTLYRCTKTYMVNSKFTVGVSTSVFLKYNTVSKCKNASWEGSSSRTVGCTWAHVLCCMKNLKLLVGRLSMFMKDHQLSLEHNSPKLSLTVHSHHSVAALHQVDCKTPTKLLPVIIQEEEYCSVDQITAGGELALTGQELAPLICCSGLM